MTKNLKDNFMDRIYILTILQKSQFKNASTKTINFSMFFGHFLILANSTFP